MKTTFDMSPDAIVEGKFVLRTGKIFQIDNYPDKSFSLNEDEADNAIAKFTPANMNIEHAPSFLDGILGKVHKIWRDGKDVLAEYHIPRWLHEETNGIPIPVSAEWDRQTKLLDACAIVLNPRVRDAACMAKFSETEDPVVREQILETMVSFAKSSKPSTYHGKQAIQEGHDHTARSGAICEMDTEDTKSKKMTASFAYKHEMKSLQAAHDIYHQAGAVCGGSPYSLYSDNTLIDNKESLMNEDEKKSWLAKFAEFLGFSPVDPVDSHLPYAPPPQTVPPATPPAKPAEFKVEDTAEFKAQKDELDRLRTEAEQREAERVAAFNTSNEAAIDALVRDGKIDPAQKAKFSAQRAKAPDVFDELAVNMPKKFEGKPKPTPGSVSGEEALEAAMGDQPAIFSDKLNHGVVANLVTTI